MKLTQLCALAVAVTSILAIAAISACKGSGAHSDGGGAPALGPGAVQVTADASGFHPSSVRFKQGAAGSLVFVRTTDETCATEVVFPELNIKKELPKGKPVALDIPTERAQKLTFQCGMGMYKSAVVIQ